MAATVHGHLNVHEIRSGPGFSVDVDVDVDVHVIGLFIGLRHLRRYAISESLT